MIDSNDVSENTERVRSGEYFREARNMYDIMIHDTMAERYFFVIITIMSTLILLIAITAMRSLYPLESSVPFIVSTDNIIDDLPHISSLINRPGEDSNQALLDFLVRNYVTFREEYNINTFDKDINGIQAQSSQEVFAEYSRYIDPHNSESPTALYERHSQREVNIVSSRILSTEHPSMEVIFDATVINKNDVKKSRWEANITFNYSGIALDQKTGKVKPLEFMVTSYRIKRLQDIK